MKDLIAYLKAIENPLDQESLLRIINVPRRGISDQTLDILTQVNRTRNIPLWNVLKNPPSDQLNEKAVKAVLHFVTLLETAARKFEEGPLTDTLKWLLDEINYKKAITDDVKSDKMREFKWENVEECLEVLSNYEKETPPEEASLHHFLTHTLLDQNHSYSHQKQFSEDKVNLMTFHSAKGLEFSACFLVGLEDHIIPHEKSLSQTGLEEERRLMYVALTRAKTHLTLSMARKRKRMGKESNSNPSRFLFEIPKELIAVSSWQSIA